MIKCLKMGCPAFACLQQSAGQLWRQISVISTRGIRSVRSAGPILRILTTARPGIPVALALCSTISLAIIFTGHHVYTKKNQAPEPIIFSTNIDIEPSAKIENQVKNPRRNAVSAADLISQLKNENLWDIPVGATIPPILFSGFPDNINLLETDIKKRTFLHTMLPVVMVAQAEIRQERAELLRITTKISAGTNDISSLAANNSLSAREISFLDALAHKYKAKSLDELLDKVNVFPVSMILAQSAIESSWGTSRFARQGNNLFGVWTWGARGIVPARREAGKRHKIAIYDSIFDSVKAYILTLNKLPAYKGLRELRKQTMNPVIIARGLRLYSERRDRYVSDVQQVITYNDLQKYDHVFIADDKAASPLELAANISASNMMPCGQNTNLFP